MRDPKTNRLITLTRTVYGNIELNFENTKIIRNGKIVDLNEVDNPDNEGTTIEQLSRADESAQQSTQFMKQFQNTCENVPNQKPLTSIQNSYAVDIGKFKAGMDQVDKNEVKRVIEESSCNSEFYKT